MKQNDSQGIVDLDHKSKTRRKKKCKLWVVVICTIAFIALVLGSAVLYVKYYRIPHDTAVQNYNSSVEQYNIAVAALEKRNQELDDSISELGEVIYKANIPVDDFLLVDANSVMEQAHKITKDAAPVISEIPHKTDEINAASSRILELIPKVEALGNYSDIIELLSSTRNKYQSMIEQFEGCMTEIIWTGVDEDNTVLRFVAKLSNPNPYPMRNVVTEWIAYDKNDAIVGSFDGFQPDIPANSHIYYIGGAGSANLSGTPAYVKMEITTEGILTNRTSPAIAVSNVEIEDHGFSWFTVSADCMTDSKITTENLNGLVIIKDADGQIISADFWRAENLPDAIDANGKFILSNDVFSLPAMPTDAEVYMYYVW